MGYNSTTLQIGGRECRYWATPDNKVHRWYFKDGSFIQAFKIIHDPKYRTVQVPDSGNAKTAYDTLTPWKRYEHFKEKPK